MNKRSLALLFISFTFFILTSCSKDSKDPVSNNLTENAANAVDSITQDLLWGYWDITLDPNSNVAEIVPMRSAEYTLNLVKFLQPPLAPQNQIEIFINDETNWYEGYVVVDVTLHHPFPNYDYATGFDVRGVLIGDGSIQSQVDPSVRFAGPNDLFVANADGYTRWFNPSEFTSFDTLFGFTKSDSGTQTDDFTATINGYKYFCESIDLTSNPGYFFGESWFDNPRGYFAPSSIIKRKYIAQFPMVGGDPQYRFQFACLANWAMPLNTPPSIPDDFPIEANAPEVYATALTDFSDLFYMDDSFKGGDFYLQVKAFDHQGATNPEGVSGEINAIHLESMDNLFGSGSMTYSGASLDSALILEDEFSATYLFKIEGIVPTASGWFPILVELESASPDNYFSGNPAFDYPTDAKLTAYFVAYIEVDSYFEYWPPLPHIEVLEYPITAGNPIKLDGTQSDDPDGGLIELYEWDFDNDGEYGDAFDSGTMAQPVIHFDDPGTYLINLRVTDNEGATNVLEFPYELVVNTGMWEPFAYAEIKTLPPYNAGNPIAFSAEQSYDFGGGEIVTYEWDFDGDGVFGDSFDSGTSLNPVVIYTNPGSYLFDLKVTDNDGMSDTVDFPYEITIGSDSLSPIAMANLETAPPHHVGTLIELDASFSNDPDGGSIISYEWDFNGDGIYGDTFSSGSEVSPIISYDTEGSYEVDVRVTDNENDFDTLDSKISVNITPVTVSGWARNAGGEMWDYGYDSTCDDDGNSFLVGVFEETVDFDPGPGVNNHTAVGLWDIYVVKYDINGNFVWAKTWGSDWGEENAYGVACDGAGNVYVSGTFDTTMDFNPGSGVNVVNAYGFPDGFLTKFSADGTYQWTKSWGEGVVWQYGISADDAGNVYLAGSFWGTIDFDSSPGTDVHTSTGDVYHDSYLTKWNSDGSYGWTKTFGSDVGDDAYGVGADGSGNVYVSGSFEGPTDFDPGPGIEQYSPLSASDVYCSKFNSSGVQLWTRVWGSDNFNSDFSYGLDVNDSGTVAIAGVVSGPTDFNPDPGNQGETSINGWQDGFVSVLDSAGNYLWAATLGGPDGYDNTNAVTIDNVGSVFITGDFYGEADFDPSAGELLVTPVGESDAYVVKYENNGSLSWAHTFGGGYLDYGRGIDLDSSGNIFAGGTFWDFADFDPGPEVEDHLSNGANDGYVLKLLPDGSW